MTCQNAGCTTTATVKTRFGDGLTHITGSNLRQTFVYYCGPHFQEVDALFRLCDVTLLVVAA